MRNKYGGEGEREEEEGKGILLILHTYTKTLCDDNLIPRDVPSECANK
jgi:hypothetical protein